MYNLGDTSYRQQPAVMSEHVVEAALQRIRQHAVHKGLESVKLIFHGGDPLLAGEAFFRHFVETATRILTPEVTPQFSMQTNAVLLSEKWLELLGELKIHFGISLDGPAEIHDANRVDHQGRGSYQRVAQAIALIRSRQECGRISTRVLTVVNLESDTLRVYKHIRALGAAVVDFLLPDGTYDAPPPGKSSSSDDTPYADWLIPIFDEWLDNSDTEFKIRLFENIVSLILGAEYTTEYIGGRQGSVVVIETDGGIEPVSALKACGEGVTKVGLNVLNNEIDEICEIPLFRPYLLGADALCGECKECPIVRVCGGGYLPHRYSSANGFDNPSIYCRDLSKLIAHIQNRTLNALPANVSSLPQLPRLSASRAAPSYLEESIY